MSTYSRITPARAARIVKAISQRQQRSLQATLAGVSETVRDIVQAKTSDLPKPTEVTTFRNIVEKLGITTKSQRLGDGSKLAKLTPRVGMADEQDTKRLAAIHENMTPSDAELRELVRLDRKANQATKVANKGASSLAQVYGGERRFHFVEAMQEAIIFSIERNVPFACKLSEKPRDANGIALLFIVFKNYFISCTFVASLTLYFVLSWTRSFPGV